MEVILDLVAASAIFSVGWLARALWSDRRYWGVRHKHGWRRIGATTYDSITGPRTIITRQCECGRLNQFTVRGEFKLGPNGELVGL